MAAKSKTKTPRRQAGKTYVYMNESDPWHGLEVTWLAHTRPYRIGLHRYADCYLPGEVKRLTKHRPNELRALRLEHLW